MAALYIDYQLTPAAESELEQALDEYKERIIKNAGCMQGKLSLSRDDIKRSRKTIVISNPALPGNWEATGNTTLDRLFPVIISSILMLKLAVLTMVIYTALPKMSQLSSVITISLALANCGLSGYIAYYLWMNRRKMKQEKELAGMIVWQWSAIEALSSSHIQQYEGTPRVIAIFEYLTNELNSMKKTTQLREILKARNNIIHQQHIELRKIKKLVKDADEIIKYLREKNKGTKGPTYP